MDYESHSECVKEVMQNYNRVSGVCVCVYLCAWVLRVCMLCVVFTCCVCVCVVCVCVLIDVGVHVRYYMYTRNSTVV